MSNSLEVYLLDVAATRALVGSGDDQLLEVIRDSFADQLARDDEYFSDLIDSGAPAAYDALCGRASGSSASVPEARPLPTARHGPSQLAR